ncbi:hypothetical protein ACG04R_28190 [Roseateles sp. BYS78W]|uniref:DUF1488 family protein n=1 Tax=Pelomonas candidula TaxID=3299025 RepID=A0ABW7HLJ9_9BURK
MDTMFFANDGSASAWFTVRPHPLGFVGMVNLVLAGKTGCSVRHECLRIRASRDDALEDARADARELVRMWSEERVQLGDL